MRNLKCISRLMTWRSLLCLVPFLFFSQGANAAIYKWRMDRVITEQLFPDPASACKAFVAHMGATSPTWESDVKFVSVTINPNGYKAICKYTFRYNGESVVQDSTDGITRVGNECGPGETYNPLTGKCDAPEPEKCEPTIGALTSHQHRMGDFTGGGAVGGRSDPPGSICKSECQYAWDGKPPTSAYRFKDNNPNGVYGSFTYKGNGVECTGETPPATAPTSNDPTKEKSKECTGKVTDAEGRVHTTCTESDVSKNPGDMNCGTVNGGSYACTPRANTPKLDDKKVKKEITETTNSDGSKTTSTTTTTTNTSCVGAGACSTTTTTHTGTKGTNADGSPGGSSETCVGPGCEGDAEDGSDIPEEEPQECDPETDPNKCGQSSVEGEPCDAAISCSGDAVQCAILRQQKIQQCNDEEFREITPEKESELKSDLQSEFAGDDFQPIKAEEADKHNFADIIDTSGRFSSSCPGVPDVRVPWLDGSSVAIPIGNVFSELCPYLVWFGYILVAMALRHAAEIIAGGFN